MKYVLISMGVFLLTVPLSVKVRAMASLSDKKIYYSLFLFFVRINSGYVSFRKKYAVINYSDKKAIAVSIKALKPSKEMNADMFRFEFLTINNVLLLGDISPKNLFIAAIFNTLNGIIYPILKEKRQYTNYGGDVYLTKNGRYLFMTEIKIAFNILIIAEMLIKKLIGGITEYAKRKFG